MTDLERARAHLLYEQANLAAARRWLKYGARPSDLQRFEDAFVAAIEWVAVAQQKAFRHKALNAIEAWYDSHLGPQPYEYERAKEITELRYALWRSGLKHD